MLEKLLCLSAGEFINWWSWKMQRCPVFLIEMSLMLNKDSHMILMSAKYYE